MTKPYSQPVHCPRCGLTHTAENAFSRWVRNRTELDSAGGFVVSDFDYFIHRYQTPVAERKFQCVMFLEVKTNAAKVSKSQAKTLSIARQLFQNQADGQGVSRVQDGIRGSWIRVRNYGGFELRLSRTSPENSEWMQWSGKPVDLEDLLLLLRFDLDPLKFAHGNRRATDWRSNHHHPDQTFPLFNEELTHFLAKEQTI